MENQILYGYKEDSKHLIEAYESVKSSELLAHVIGFIPETGQLLDIGAGTGRDAAWLSSNDLKVFAVEPVEAFRNAGQTLHSECNIEWIDDSCVATHKAWR